MGLTAFNRMRRSKAGNVAVSEVEPIPSLLDIRERAKELGIPNAGKKSEKRLLQEIQVASDKMSVLPTNDDVIDSTDTTEGEV